jgi:hypothetical protein
VGLLFAARQAGKARRPPAGTAADRSRAVTAALWIDEHSAEPVSLDAGARVTGLSAFPFPAGVRPGARRAAAPVSGALPAAPREARMLAEGGESITGIAVAGRFRRPVQLRAHVSPGGWNVAAPLSQGRNFHQVIRGTARIPFSVRAYQLAEFGDVDGIRLVERDDPKPGPTEILVRVHVASINRRDLMLLHRTIRGNVDVTLTVNGTPLAP